MKTIAADNANSVTSVIDALRLRRETMPIGEVEAMRMAGKLCNRDELGIFTS